ncbi:MULTISPECIES: DUF680 domain-containing protein [Mesorhizobium]|uniref:Uncharacterized protein n=1 Tax=Rhizobium loti TaxID=381 RepID=A0A6M7TYQ2_RHILI|nr:MULTISPECIES: DUF680 domain-containing protein [Mesorhizobium]KRB21142.1 hypothetical protein ASE05_21060 [Mesorhizobium sp. Root172]OBQ65841.1 hypothetical protein A8145_17045 [Mesorhizobium loti]QKC68973.1 DUF680 domain-containing protein [Mesorhizobium loti]QKC88281.1 DUF680 domain-containing protein [Mesorhizobium sp. NZP2234]
MTKIALTATALLIAAGAAFAGSDKFGSNATNQPAATGVDSTITTSIAKSGAADQQPVVQGADRNLFGNR